MVTPPRQDSESLSELHERLRRERAISLGRIERAGGYVELYRSRMTAMQEGFWELAARHGVVDDPGFRTALERVSADVDENVRGAAVVIARLEEGDRLLAARQAEELDSAVRERRTKSGAAE